MSKSGLSPTGLAIGALASLGFVIVYFSPPIFDVRDVAPKQEDQVQELRDEVAYLREEVDRLGSQFTHLDAEYHRLREIVEPVSSCYDDSVGQAAREVYHERFEVRQYFELFDQDADEEERAWRAVNEYCYPSGELGEESQSYLVFLAKFDWLDEASQDQNIYPAALFAALIYHHSEEN